MSSPDHLPYTEIFPQWVGNRWFACRAVKQDSRPVVNHQHDAVCWHLVSELQADARSYLRKTCMCTGTIWNRTQ